MNDRLQAYLRDPEPLNDGDHTSLYRQAMNEVLKLSAAGVQPLESQIESDYQIAKQRAQERFATDQSRIEVDFQAQSQELRRRHDARTETIRADYEEQFSTLKVDAHHGHNRVNQKTAELKSAAEKEHQDQVMVADYVAEGGCCKDPARTHRGAIGSSRRTLASGCSRRAG